jgi:lipopolysaccharide export system permease protein
MAVICFGAYWWNDLVVPSANHRFQTEVRRLSMQEDLPLFKENVVFKGPQNRFIFLKSVDHKHGKISGILIIEAGVPGKWPRLITADYGKLHRGVWELFNGIIHEIDDKGAVKSELSYQKMQLKMATDYSVMLGEDRSAAEMRAGELLNSILIREAA